MLTAMATRINQQTNVNIYAGRFLKRASDGSYIYDMDGPEVCYIF